MVNSRKLAVKALLKIENDNSYSNLTINSIFKDIEISKNDKAFVTALIYGVIERKITLDYILAKHIKTPLKKVSSFSLTVLRVALYQILFMDKIPDSAAVNEAVKIVKNSKESRNSGFVNAVLRNVLRSDKALPNGENIEDLSVRYSCPDGIIESLIKDYGKINAIELLKASLEPASLTLRVNTVKTDIDTFLNEIDVNAKISEVSGGVILSNGIDVANHELYKQGKFFVQDIASQKTVAVLNPKPNERMLDMCSAPGGKSFSSAIMMENKGEIISCDLYEHKCKLISDGAKRLGLDIIKPKVQDSTVYNKDLGEFDCILCDVLCSGLGIIRRKPEIKYKDMSEFENLPQIQIKILENAKNYLKKGGRILYSTCTLRKAENEDVVNEFLSQNKDFTLKYSHTFMPHIDGTDGFFCALIERN